MSRNRYAKVIRRGEREQIAKQERELVAIAHRVACPNEVAVKVLFVPPAKARRSARMYQMQRHKSERRAAIAEICRSL